MYTKITLWWNTSVWCWRDYGQCTVCELFGSDSVCQ